MDAPEQIELRKCNESPPQWIGTTGHRYNGTEPTATAYVRADLYAEREKEIERLKADAEDLRQIKGNYFKGLQKADEIIADLRSKLAAAETRIRELELHTNRIANACRIPSDDFQRTVHEILVKVLGEAYKLGRIMLACSPSSAFAENGSHE